MDCRCTWEGIFIGAILTATSVSISAQTLLEIGALRTREGSTILGAAVIDDVMGIIVLSLVVALAKASGTGFDWAALGLVVVRVTLFFTAAIAARHVLPPILRWASTLGVSQAVLSAGLVIMFVYAWAAEYVGAVAAITGSYLAGVLIAQTDFKKEIDAGIHPLTYSIFVPLFFISIGLEANGRELGPRAMFTVALVLVAMLRDEQAVIEVRGRTALEGEQRAPLARPDVACREACGRGVGGPFLGIDVHHVEDAPDPRGMHDVARHGGGEHVDAIDRAARQLGINPALQPAVPEIAERQRPAGAHPKQRLETLGARIQ